MPRLIADPIGYFSAINRDDAVAEALAAQLAQEASRQGVPIIGPVMGRLMMLLALASGARRILELGSAIGYSTSFLARAVSSTGGRVMAVDMHMAHCRSALRNLERMGLRGSCDVLCADARSLPFGAGGFDFIFLDVDQRYYLELEPVCHGLLRLGGLLVADNTAFADAKAFNDRVGDPARWFAVNLFALLPGHAPEHDGLCLALKM